MTFSEADAELGHITLEGAAAIRVIGGALPLLTDRGVVGPSDFPLLRALHDTIARDRPLRIPWAAMVSGDPTKENAQGEVLLGVDIGTSSTKA